MRQAGKGGSGVKVTIIGEARRRGVFRMAATYLVTAWLVLEVGYVLTNVLSLPKPIMKAIFGLLVAGFPLVTILAWNFRLTDAGLLRHSATGEPENFGDGHAEHHAGHGGHGASVGGIDPLPIIFGVMVLGALILLVAIKGFGFGADMATDTGQGEAPATVASAPAAPAALAVRAVAPNSIAVMPFDNLSGDPNQAFFSDGLSEELRGALAGVAGLQVAARTSSNAFRDTKDDVTAIGSKLGVAYTLEGSVRRAGNVVRVNAQLIEAKTGFERWSQSYDREMRDVFVIQSDIATRVTEALKVQLLPRETQALAGAGRSAMPAAYDAFLRGRQLFDLSGDESSYRAALAQFDAAIAADPGYAAAHAARARTLAVIAGQFDSATTIAATNAAALAAARKAVALAPTLGDAQLALAYVLARTGFDLAGANAAYEAAIGTSGGNADALISYGTFNARVGDAAKGLAALDKAVALDRFNPRAWKALGSATYAARRFADAEPLQRQALKLSPGLAAGHYDLGLSLLMQGDVRGAAAEFSVEKQRWAHLTGSAIAAWKLGDRAGSDKALAALIAENGNTVLYQQAQVRAQRGDSNGAIAALERGLAAGDSGLLLLRRDPLLDPLRQDPRFVRLVTRLSVPG